MQIIPSILVQSKKEFEAQILEVQNHVDMVQIDIADGKFVPNTTWSDPDLAKNILVIECELHLMVHDPLSEAEKWKNVPQVKRALFHYESTADVNQTIEKLRQYGWDISIVLNPDTPAGVLEPYLDKIQGVMFMGVRPGFQGQKYISETTRRIKEFKAKGTDHFVELDGAVNKRTIHEIAQSGADAICPGSAVFGNKKTPEENIKKLKELIEKYEK